MSRYFGWLLRRSLNAALVSHDAWKTARSDASRIHADSCLEFARHLIGEETPARHSRTPVRSAINAGCNYCGAPYWHRACPTCRNWAREKMLAEIDGARARVDYLDTSGNPDVERGFAVETIQPEGWVT